MKPTIKFNGRKWVLRFQSADRKHAWPFFNHTSAMAALGIMYRADDVAWVAPSHQERMKSKEYRIRFYERQAESCRRATADESLDLADRWGAQLGECDWLTAKAMEGE